MQGLGLTIVIYDGSDEAHAVSSHAQHSAFIQKVHTSNAQKVSLQSKAHMIYLHKRQRRGDARPHSLLQKYHQKLTD